MGTCPQCGGEQRDPLAPSFWRCTSIVIDYATAMMPAPGAPPALGILASVAVPVERVCGHEYQESSGMDDEDMQYCACDTGAIGRCANDRRPVCGYHSKLRGGRRLCDECVAAFDAEAARRAADDSYAELSPTLQKVRDVCAALSALPEPLDRLFVLLLLARAGLDGHPFTVRATPDIRQRFVTDLRAALADTATAVLPATTGEWAGAWSVTNADPLQWTFDPARLVAHWTRTGLLHGHTRLELIEFGKGVFGGVKRIRNGTVTGWLAVLGEYGSSGPYGDSGRPDTWLLEDGTVARTSHGSFELSLNGHEEPLTMQTVISLLENKELRLPRALRNEKREIVVAAAGPAWLRR